MSCDRRMRLCLAAFFIAAATWPAAAQTPRSDAPQVAGAPTPQALRLSPEAEQVADKIGVAPLLTRLKSMSGGPPAEGSRVSPEAIAVRQEVTERVLSASLDIDSVNATIDSEMEHIRRVRADSQSKRDRARNVINIASIVTGGAFGAIASAMQFKPSTVNPGNVIGAAGGAGSVLLSIIGIRKRGGRRSLGDSPRMLARFFGRRPDAAEEIPSAYPESVWSYLNSVEPSKPDAATRRERLIAKWRDEGRIAPDGSPKGGLESASGNVSRGRRLSIDELDDRAAMLLDVRASVSLMKRGLSEILRGLADRRDR